MRQFLINWLFVLLAIFFLTGCLSSQPEPIVSEPTLTHEVSMSTITIKSLDYDKAFYKLGEALTFSLQVNCEDCVGAVPVDVVFKLSFLSAEMKQERHQVELERGLQRVRISVAMPPDAPRGYGMDVQLLGSDGQILSQISSGFDVLNYWIERPRYGFLTDFWPDRTDQELTTQRLAQFHINGLQYYDWMYRHEQLLTSE